VINSTESVRSAPRWGGKSSLGAGTEAANGCTSLSTQPLEQEKPMSRKTLIALAAVATLGCALPTLSYAQVAFNVGAVTEYRYRGISQSRLKPALQGGVDYTAGPFYVGAWASTIKWIKDFGGDANVEIDLYGGYKGEITKELTYDIGVLTYQYPSNRLNPSANTTEIYGALTYGPATLKYSHSVTDTFANLDSKNSYYLDLSAGFDLGGGLMLTPHIGYQKIKGPLSDPGSYTDYAVTLSKDFSGLVVSGAVVGTDADKSFYSSPKNGKELGKATLVLGVKYNF
jgi:uncharacterized protein (TIGR02001 family)